MRDDFVYLLLGKEENKEFQKMFTRDGFFHIANTRGFVDMVWKEYKESCKKYQGCNMDKKKGIRLLHLQDYYFSQVSQILNRNRIVREALRVSFLCNN